MDQELERITVPLHLGDVADTSFLKHFKSVPQLVLTLVGEADPKPIGELRQLKILWLDVTRRPITDLSFLAGLDKLENLRLVGLGRKLESLEPLAKLVNLRRLHLTYLNEPVDLSPLGKLKHLEELNLRNTSTVDIGPLSKLTNLKRLVLAYNQVRDIKPLRDLKKLEVVDLSHNRITDITPLRDLKNLSFVNLRNNQIADISPLAENTGIGTGESTLDLGSDARRVLLQRNFLNSAAHEEHIPALQEKGLEVQSDPKREPWGAIVTLSNAKLNQAVRKSLRTLIPSREPLYESDLAGVKSLQAKNMEISDLTPFRFMTGLERLYLQGNEITDLRPLAKLVQLKGLVLDRNKVSDISPLEDLTNLRQLSLFKNKVADITPLKNLSQLRGVGLAYNQIQDFSVLFQLENLGVKLTEPVAGRARFSWDTEVWTGGNPAREIPRGTFPRKK